MTHARLPAHCEGCGQKVELRLGPWTTSLAGRSYQPSEWVAAGTETVHQCPERLFDGTPGVYDGGT